MSSLANNLVDSDRSDDLDWLAFQYVAGELSPAERAVFEGRLACDRRACEALVRMMQTADALAVAVPAVTSRSATPRSVPSVSTAWPSQVRGRMTVAVLSAACLAAVALFVVQPPSHVEHGKSPGERVGEIVSLWADTAVDADADERSLDRAILGEDSDLSVPGWMISAVEHAAQEGEPEMEEN